MEEIMKEMKEVNEIFKQQFGSFLAFKDGADQIDSFEQSLIQLTEEMPNIEKTFAKISDIFHQIELLIKDGFQESPNYAK